MDVIFNKEPIISTIEKYFSSFGFILDSFFQSKNQHINAMIVLQKLKERACDPGKLQTFLSSLPQERWTVDIFSNKIEELNNLFGITDDEISKHCVTEVTKADLQSLKWELNIQAMLQSSKFANEYYDALKYNKNAKLSIMKMRLRNELMMVFKYIKEFSTKVYDKYEHKNYSERNIQGFNSLLFPIELLWMRILYVLFQLNDSDDRKIGRLTEVLSMDRVSLAYQKIYMPRYT